MRKRAVSFLAIVAIATGVAFLSLQLFKVDFESKSAEFVTLKVIGVSDEHTVVLRNLSTGKDVTWKVENAYSQGYEVGSTINVIPR